MSNTKLFYSYKDTNNTGKVPVQYLSYYSDSIIFDEDNRRLWHNGKQYGNTYWGTKHGETFNNIDNNYAYNYAHAEGSYSYAAGESSHTEGSYSYAGGSYSHVEGIRNSAYGIGSHVEGGYSYAVGAYSHAEGSYSYAGGSYSHVEGIRNSAYGIGSHVEGGYSYAVGAYSHAEGISNSAYGFGSHAEGNYSVTYSDFSHVEGIRNSTYNLGSHAEGNLNQTFGFYSHVEGVSNSANGIGSHVEGNYSVAYSDFSHVEGNLNQTHGPYSHVEGSINSTYGFGSHAEGWGTSAEGEYSHTQGKTTYSPGDYSDAQGVSTVSFGYASHSEGLLTYAYSYYSHTEGEKTSTYGLGSHAEGWRTSAEGEYSHAEGQLTKSYARVSHSEGLHSITYGPYSHAEGYATFTFGPGSHSEGASSIAYGPYSHAEGGNTYAAKEYSHTQGLGTVAYNACEAAFGKYNNSVTTDNNKTIYSIGNGTSNADRKNIIDFRENGDMYKNGSSYFHNDIYGPVSYTYVKSLGKEATLDIVLSSVLTRPEYTRPKIEVQYKLSNGSSFKTVNSTSSYEETVELGTYFYPEFKVVWPTRTQTNTTGTRAYDAVCLPSKPNYLLGYSYGVSSNGITILYNNGGGKNNTNPNGCNSTYTAYALDTLHRGATSPCYILGETTYTLFNNLKISYLPFSHMYFPQLYNNGVYIHSTGLSPKEWLNGGTYSLGGYKVRGRLKYYWGFSGDSVNPGKNHPTNETVLKGQNFGWLNPTGKTEINTGSIGITNASKYCLWIAYPDTNDSLTNALIKNKHFTLVNNPNNNFKIEVLMKDGMNFDLVSPNQPLKSTYMNINLANKDYNIRYKISYIDFQKPIGNVNDVLKFIIESNIT